MFYFIVNITSRAGKAEKVWSMIENELRIRNVEYEAFLTSYEGHAGKIASKLCEKDTEKVNLVVVGGDGTVNEVLNGITDFDKIQFGYIPTGSGNDLGRGLGIGKDPLKILDVILSGEHKRKMDIGSVTTELDSTERFFAISAGIGVDADVCKEALHSGLKKFLNQFGLGKLTYMILTVKRIFTMPALSAELTIEDGENVGEHRNYHDVVFIAGMNHYAEGGGIPMAPMASAFDGAFDVCIFWGHGRLQTLFMFPLLLTGRHEKVKRFEFIHSNEFTLHMKEPVVLHTDGEYGGTVHEIHFKCYKGKLNILV